MRRRPERKEKKAKRKQDLTPQCTTKESRAAPTKDNEKGREIKNEKEKTSKKDKERNRGREEQA